MKNVGIVGVGRMGHGIAKNISVKGWALKYLRHVGNQPTEDLDAHGSIGFDSAVEVAAASDIILICVTGTPQVEDVLIGSGAVLQALNPGAIVVDCSTAVPNSTRELAARVKAKGCHFIDAAMTRTPKEAEEGRLNLLVGGEPQVLDQVRPVLECFAENIFHAGNVGSGHQLKLVHNIISLGSVALIAEVAACAIADGIDKEAMIDCLRKGGAGGIPLERIAPYILAGDTAQLQFTMDNAHKDTGYYRKMAELNGARSTVADAVYDTFAKVVSDGNGGAFVPELASLLQGK